MDSNTNATLLSDVAEGLHTKPRMVNHILTAIRHGRTVLCHGGAVRVLWFPLAVIVGCEASSLLRQPATYGKTNNPSDFIVWEFHHYSFMNGKSLPFAWVSTLKKQCPGTCAFTISPFLVGIDSSFKAFATPKGDVCVKGMINVINHDLAEMPLNPLGNALYAGDEPAVPIELAGLCLGIYGTGASVDLRPIGSLSSSDGLILCRTPKSLTKKSRRKRAFSKTRSMEDAEEAQVLRHIVVVDP